MRLPYMTANVYLGINSTAIGYTGSEGFLYKEIVSGTTLVDVFETVEIQITFGAPNTPVTWSNLSGNEGFFRLDENGQYTLSVTHDRAQDYIYSFRFAATGNILTHKITVVTDPWIVELLSRTQNNLGVGPAPITVYEGENLTFKVTAPSNVPENLTAYLIIGAPSTVDMDDISRPTNSAEVVMSGRIGTGSIAVNLDLIEEDIEYFTVWVEYPPGSLVGSYGRVNIIDTTEIVEIKIQPILLPYAVIGSLYSVNLVATGGVAPYDFEITIGTLPVGIILDINGTLSGIATVGGTAYFTVTATDANGNIGTQNYVLTASLSTISISLPSVSATKNLSYSNQLVAVGGKAPYTFSRIGGSLPTGLTVSTGGLISGIVQGNGSYSFFIQAVDSIGSLSVQQFSITVITPVLGLIPATMPSATVSQSWYQWILTTGTPTGTLNYEIINTLTFTSEFPPGITYFGDPLKEYLSSEGPYLLGTPTVAGSYEFLIQVTDNGGNQDSKIYKIDVIPDEVVNFVPHTVYLDQSFILAMSGGMPGGRFRYKLSNSANYGEWITMNQANGPGTHQQVFPPNLFEYPYPYTYNFEFEYSGLAGDTENNFRSATITILARP